MRRNGNFFRNDKECLSSERYELGIFLPVYFSVSSIKTETIKDELKIHLIWVLVTIKAIIHSITN